MSQADGTLTGLLLHEQQACRLCTARTNLTSSSRPEDM